VKSKWLVLVSEIAVISPPVGMNVFVLHGLVKDEISMGTIYRGIFPFLAAEVVMLVLIFIFPGLALLLPGFMK
jgi:C4-dicarboxylate transporter, DctM subunit